MGELAQQQGMVCLRPGMYLERPPSLSMCLAEALETVEAVWRCLASRIS